MLITSEGIFLRQLQQKSYCARVCIEVVDEVIAPTIKVRLDNSSLDNHSFSQGNVVTAFVPAYNDWIQGSVIGARYALMRLDSPTYTVTIKSIFGLDTDTNPTIVAVASAFAVWNAADYQPPTNEIHFLEHKALSSWELAFDALPIFTKE